VPDIERLRTLKAVRACRNKVAHADVGELQSSVRLLELLGAPADVVTAARKVARRTLAGLEILCDKFVEQVRPASMRLQRLLFCKHPEVICPYLCTAKRCCDE
jgi:hypothetical protein